MRGQICSFYQELDITALYSPPFHAIFIRAPILVRVGESVKVISALPYGMPVAVRQGNRMATSFHPELTNDTRFHQYFLDLAAGKVSGPAE